LRTRLQAESLETLKSMPQPSYEPIVLMTDQKIIPEIRKQFADQYLYNVAWQTDSSSLNQEMNNLHAWLKHILTLKGVDLGWFATWVNSNESLSYVTLEDFWGGSLSALRQTSVPPVFTLKGKKQIDSFLNEMESALVDPLIIAGQKLEFQTLYRKAYFQAWHNFGLVFPEGVKRLQGREERRQLAARMAINQGPYFAVLNKMAIELKPLTIDHDVPSWVERIYEFQSTKAKAAKLEIGSKGGLAKVADKGKTIISRLEKKIGKVDGKKTLESQLLAAKAFREYQNALAEVMPAAASKTVAYHMAAQAFNEDTVTSKSPFFVARMAYDKLSASMAGKSTGNDKFMELCLFGNCLPSPGPLGKGSFGGNSRSV